MAGLSIGSIDHDNEVVAISIPKQVAMITLNEVRFEMNSEDSREVNLKYDENKGTMRWAGGRNFGILRYDDLLVVDIS